jgi:hypothetical protein
MRQASSRYLIRVAWRILGYGRPDARAAVAAW